MKVNIPIEIITTEVCNATFDINVLEFEKWWGGPIEDATSSDFYEFIESNGNGYESISRAVNNTHSLCRRAVDVEFSLGSY